MLTEFFFPLFRNLYLYDKVTLLLDNFYFLVTCEEIKLNAINKEINKEFFFMLYYSRILKLLEMKLKIRGK